MVEIFARYNTSYGYASYSDEYLAYLSEVGTIVYIDQIDHFLVNLTE